jgi:hypothetical protein
MRRFVLVVALGFALPGPARAATIRVPGQVSTIQAAINLAVEGDTVLVAPGTYRQRLHLVLKNLVVRGEQGADLTIVDGSVSLGNVVTCQLVGRTTILEGLTITGGEPNGPDSVGAGIYCNEGSPTIRNCKLVGNRSRAGGGVAAYFFSEPAIHDCFIAHNEGGGVVVETGVGDLGRSWAEIVNCVLVRNEGFGVWVLKRARVRVYNDTVAYNNSHGITIDQGAIVDVRRNIFSNNIGGGVVRLDNTACYITLSCNDVVDNIGGSYSGTNPGDPCFSGRGSGDVSIDPQYQDAASDNFHLRLTSPLCALRQQGACGVLGAFADPCQTSVEPRSWSRVKTLYR